MKKKVLIGFVILTILSFTFVNAECTESWTCTDWSDCITNQQTRTCTDANNCGTQDNKPFTSFFCRSGIKCDWADMNENGKVDYGDFAFFGICFPKDLEDAEDYCEKFDYDEDEEITFGDFSFFATCINDPLTCGETDNGKDYFNKGFITAEGDSSSWDECSSDSQLTEYYCEGNSIKIQTYNCLNGCEEGACYKCTESWTCTDWSTCTNNQQTRTCSDTNACGTEVNKPSISNYCTSGIKCDWADMNENGIVDFGDFAFFATCFQKNIDEAEDYCERLDYDESKRIDFGDFAFFATCFNGTKKCGDTDNGKDYFTKGFVTTGRSLGYWDACFEDSQLKEYYCEDDEIKELIYTCSSCKDGVCLEQPENLCTPIGLRKSKKYCSSDEIWLDEKEKGAFCENNFECKSNLCIDDECIKQGFFKKIMQWFRRIFSRS